MRRSVVASLRKKEIFADLLGSRLKVIKKMNSNIFVVWDCVKIEIKRNKRMIDRCKYKNHAPCLHVSSDHLKCYLFTKINFNAEIKVRNSKRVWQEYVLFV